MSNLKQNAQQYKTRVDDSETTIHDLIMEQARQLYGDAAVYGVGFRKEGAHVSPGDVYGFPEGDSWAGSQILAWDLAQPDQDWTAQYDQTPEPDSRASEDVMDLTRKFFGG